MSGYDLDPATPSFVTAQADYAARSISAADLPGALFDVPYGPHDRHRLDVFPAGASAPAILFLRGGYWRVGSKEERRFPALAWHPRGVTWIVANYRLAPDATIPEIVDDARHILNFAARSALDWDIDPNRLHVIGNSAGAHLAAMIAAENGAPPIASLTLISGLFDMEPLLSEAANEWLQMDARMARDMSPMNHRPPPDLPIIACVGGDESAEFKLQTDRYAAMCRDNGNPVTQFESPGKDHIQIIGECGTPGTPVFEALACQIL